MAVDTTHADYDAMKPKWRRLRDAYDGSDAVKLRGNEYLPLLDSHMQPARGADLYAAYKARAVWYNATARTVDGLAGGIFQKTPSIVVPPSVEEDVRDITMTGAPLEQFALTATRETLLMGRYGILVEFPKEGEELRPYWIPYRAEDIFAWRHERRGGRQVVTGVALMEEVDKAVPAGDDALVSGTIPQIKLLLLEGDRYQQRRWQQPEEQGEWIEVGAADDGPVTPFEPLRRGAPLPFIPFIFLGPNGLGPTVQKPGLLDLVDMNYSHYRTMADLEHGRHWTALPTPWVAGAVGGDKAAPLAIGSGAAWELSEGGRAGMLEFTGQGLGALERADESKKSMMAVLGARMLEEQPSSAETFGAVTMRHASEHATLRTVAQSVEQGLTQAMRWHAWWTGTEARPVEVDAAVELNKDFIKIRATPQEVQASLLALQAEAISFKTFYWNLQQGEWGRPGVTADEERDQIIFEGGTANVGDLNDLPVE
jgi:hypothetical protein